MLQIFTIEDRQKLVSLLSLSIDELEENSLLYRLLAETESRDSRLGTTLSVEVQNLITDASALKDTIFGSISSGDQYLKSEESYLEGAVTWKDNGSELQGKWDRLNQYLFDIQRNIGYTLRPTGNRLRTEWPSGRTQDRAFGQSLNRFF
jgi:hypothetical protein